MKKIFVFLLILATLKISAQTNDKAFIRLAAPAREQTQQYHQSSLFPAPLARLQAYHQQIAGKSISNRGICL
jgi:hypothetical protein